MGRVRLYLALGLCVLLQSLVLIRFPVWGIFPVLLPGLVCLVGIGQGADRGAECGLLGGLFLFLTGTSPGQIALLALLGGLSGVVFHKPVGFWGSWLCCLPALAGYEGLLVLGHWLMGAGWLPPLRIAGPEFLLAAAGIPLVWGILWLVSRHPKRKR